jgi:hypothetical protein
MTIERPYTTEAQSKEDFILFLHLFIPVKVHTAMPPNTQQ